MSRRNRDIDEPVERGKDEQDWSNLIVNAPPLLPLRNALQVRVVDCIKLQGMES